jgi:hypothetical protein
MLAIFSILIHAISLTFYKTLNVIVHNQYPVIELTSPVYFCNHGTYYEYPVEKIDDGAIMKTGFRFDPEQNEPGGILMYEVQRKESEISDPQSGIDTIYTKVIKKVSKMMRLLITWNIKHLEEPKVHIMLIEYGDESIPDEDRLAQLYNKINSMLLNHNRCMWLVRDCEALKTTYEVVQKEYLELKIIISKIFSDLVATKPIWVDSER